KYALDTAAVLVRDDVQSTFLFQGSGPATGAVVLAVGHRARAWPAADAGIALIVQGIVRHRVPGNERPHVLLGPGKERIDLHQPELGIPLHHAGRSAMLGLVAANGAKPGIVAHQRLAKRQHLAIVAALVRPNSMQRPAML